MGRAAVSIPMKTVTPPPRGHSPSAVHGFNVSLNSLLPVTVVRQRVCERAFVAYHLLVLGGLEYDSVTI